MCGIVGYIGKPDATETLLDGLSRLEYRGYDSAGVTTLVDGSFYRRRVEGKLSALKQALKKEPLPEATLGIAHTRWATHGGPSEANAHPHEYNGVSIVHNGILENHAQLKKELEERGHSFTSETDSEVFAHLFSRQRQEGDAPLQALQKALAKVRGSYAVVLIDQKDPGSLYAARKGSPLVLGHGEGEYWLASDVPALLPYTREVSFLEEGTLLKITRQGYEAYDLNLKSLTLDKKTITWSLAMAEKGGYKHFMLKEIYEEPRALSDTLTGRLLGSPLHLEVTEVAQLPSLNQVEKVHLIACGTSYHAALTGRYFLENWTGLFSQVENASEFRYREPVLDDKTLVIALSQSGETADTLEAVRLARSKGAKTLTITNVLESTLARESGATFYTHAGPEIGVAATKTFVCQILALHLVSLALASLRKALPESEAINIYQDLLSLPEKFSQSFKACEVIKDWALDYSTSPLFLFMGRGPEYPIALEGALKLKEISYLNAEGYSAGELKHGPIALIEPGVPVIALAPQDKYYEKMLSNIAEVKSRGASVIAIGNEGDKQLGKLVKHFVGLPKVSPWIQSFLNVLPLQLFAYFIADQKGLDVDQPRNLAKSVTVE